MRTIKINFADFWPNFSKTDNYFYLLLKQKYDVVISEDPELIFFSVDYPNKKERDRYPNAKKVFFTGENVRPNFGLSDQDYPRYSIGPCDVALSFDPTHGRNYRFPLWAFFINWFGGEYDHNRDPAYLIPLTDLDRKNQNYPKSKFCNFVFSNTSGERVNIFHLVSSYKRIDSYGTLLNNSGVVVPGRGDQIDKINFIKNYKFTISAENSKFDGYTTEKMIHPMSVGSVPIYWGSDMVESDFNNSAFINANRLSEKDLVDLVRHIDNDERTYTAMTSAPIFAENALEVVSPDSILRFIESIL